jgi:phospholipid transport system substrate-binding protein
MQINSRILLLLLFFVLPAQALANPAETIRTYHDRLLDSIASTAGETDQARYEKLAPAMDAAFDFESMIKTAAGSHWGKASADAREALLAAFRRVSIATYADQFGGMKGGEFVIQGTRNGPRGLKLVDCQLKTGTESVPLSYVVRNKDGQWLIIDVLLDGGISELALRASEYASTLKGGGTEALTKTLNDQATALLAH